MKNSTELTDIQHFSKITKGIKFAMLTTIDADRGALVSRPMTLQQVEFDGDLWFFANRTSEMVNQIENNINVNLAFSNPKDMSFLSAQGNAAIVDDVKKAKQMWNPMYKAWFPEGIEDPNLCLLKISVHSADYWESPDSRIVRLVGLAKAIITGERSNAALGHQGHLDLN